jgi:hypothetical protein
MTMHLEGPWLSTTATKKRQTKRTKAEQARFEQEYQSYNKSMKQQGRHAEMMSLADYDLYVRGILSKNKIMSKGEYQPSKSYRRETPNIPSRDSGIGVALLKPKKEYTGTLIKGIATMHKSNAVPIISDEQAVDIARMRR